MERYIMSSSFRILILSMTFGFAVSCGGITHIEISYRALNNFKDDGFDTIIRQNPSALEAGSSYPDAFYFSICYDGKYHAVSEDTHWTPFINASINYIRNHYPQPWTVATQRLIAFLMGSVSHAVADISWHSLGIPQGFLRTMAWTNYHGDFSSAHSDGDLGGDVLNLFQLNLSYSDIFGEWYVPTTDLLAIYRELYGENKINETVIEACTQLLYLAKVGERLVMKKYFPISARKSPFLLDNLYDYFLGGIDDMSTWTRRIWKHVTFALENGQKDCDMPRNPLYIRCGKKRKSKSEKTNIQQISGKGIFYREPDLLGLNLDNVLVERDGRGIWLRTSKKLKEKVLALERELNLLDKESKKRNIKIHKNDAGKVQDKKPGYPTAVLSVASKYAKLGRAYAVADLDEDGNEDVVIGAPGFYSPSGQQNGMVFIMYGTDYGLNVSSADIYQAADVRIPGPESDQEIHSEFGSSLAIFDFDKDGYLDIAIGAPSYGSENLTYTGQVFVFSVLKRKKFSLRGVVTCKEVYCNMGSTLATGDVNSDLYHDLLVASPFAPGGGQQRGILGAVYADKKYQGRHGLQLSLSRETFMTGSQDYSWFGKTVDVKAFEDHKTIVALGEPSFRKCVSLNCSFEEGDIQAIGQVHIIIAEDNQLKPYRDIKGRQQFEMMGSAVAMGKPYDKYTDILAVTSSGSNVKGHVRHVPVEFHQVGTVALYNISNSYQYPVAHFNGDRRFGRFGAQLKFADLNRDGYDDLIIGDPLRTRDLTEELHGAEQGRVFIYMGGPTFPKGDATTNCGPRHLVEPCPGETASYVLSLDEQQARFGSQIAIVHSKNKNNLLVTAAHSSIGERLSGAIAVFDF